jgi:clorobiocin biosynthesis protein CloN4
MCDRGITAWCSVPSVVGVIRRGGDLLGIRAPRQLKVMCFGGEPSPIEQLRALREWVPDCRILNMFGSSETQACMVHEVTALDLGSGRPVPMGRPLPGLRAWPATTTGAVAAVGEVGELVVDGPSVMTGYLGQDRWTGPYRTGDLVRIDADGLFHHVGRRSGPCKLRGNRVELGEVEAVIQTHPDVDRAVAVVAGSGLAAQLYVYVVPRRNGPVGPLSIKRHVARRLLPSSVPDRVVCVDRLPLSANGKVNRMELTALADRDRMDRND